MTNELIITPEAEADMADAARWYDEGDPGRGDHFIETIEAKLDLIKSRPQAYARVRGEVRRAVVQRYPYCIYFRLAGPQVRILAVLHAARDPKTWQERTD